MKKTSILGIASALLLVSCSEDFLNKDAMNEVSTNQIADLNANYPELGLAFSGNLEAGNYFYMNDFLVSGLNQNLHDDFGQKAVDFGLDLMSNDVTQSTNHWMGNYYNFTARQTNSVRTYMIWRFYYKQIYNMNSILSTIDEGATDPGILQLKARCLAVRGFAYFQLIRVYGNGDLGIPLYTETTTDLSRVPTSDIYAQIESDLTAAHTLIDGYTRTSKAYLDNKVIAGLLSRYYLEMENYPLAAQYANEAKTGGTLVSGNQLLDGFDEITNPEWIWGADITSATTTVYASFFSNVGSLNEGYAGLLGSFKNIDRRLYDAISPTDVRKQWFAPAGNPWGIPQYANVKFVDATFFEGDYVYMRTAEMYLNEAEARSYFDEAGARQVLYDLVITRDPSYTLSTNSGQALKDEIRLHRRIELWGEGFAFFDMKRWGVDLVRDYPGSNHTDFGYFDYPAGSPKFIFQIPESELNANFEITEQNPL